MPMYFDAVIHDDDCVLFNGTPEEVKKFIEDNKDDPDMQTARVCLGENLTFTSLENYLAN